MRQKRTERPHLPRGGLLDPITGPANPGPISLSLVDFANMAARGRDPFLAFFNTDTVGDFPNSYGLRRSDADLGVGQSSYLLNLVVNGDLIAAPRPPLRASRSRRPGP